MPKPMIRIHNVETDEVIDREMTAAEYAQYQADQALVADMEAARIAAAEAKAAVLDKLGLTAEEVAALLA
jgi:hypothetical protein